MHSMKRAILKLCAMLLLVALSSGARAKTTMSLLDARETFASANALYRSQKYEEAAEGYRELLNSGYDSAPVLYNLGTTDARLGSNTLALAHLQRAKKLDPRNEDIRANLAYVKADEAVAASRTETGAATAESLWSKTYGWLTAEEWLMVVWCALLVCCVGAAMVFLLRSRRWSSAGRALVIVGGTICVITAIPAAAQVYATKIIQKAVLIEPTEMLSGPASRFTRVSRLEEGQTVRRLGHESAGYERVKTEDGVVGYVRKSELVNI